jgi:hypothetical protein
MHSEQNIREAILAVWSDVDGSRKNVPLGGGPAVNFFFGEFAAAVGQSRV